MSTYLTTKWIAESLTPDGDFIEIFSSENLDDDILNKLKEFESSDADNKVILYLERARCSLTSLKRCSEYVIVVNQDLPENYTNGNGLKIPIKYKKQLLKTYEKNKELFGRLFTQMPNWTHKINIGAEGFPSYGFRKRMWVNYENYLQNPDSYEKS